MEKDLNKTINITPTESSQTTVFLDDASVESVVVSSMSEDSISVRDTGIPAFMARPQLIRTGTWTTSQAANTELVNASVAAELAASVVWQRKVESFNLVRGTACIRLQINANPFQSGRVLMHFIPCAQDLIYTGTSVAGLWNSNIATKSTQLGVELDCRSTAAILKVPYVGPNHYYDRANQRYDWGTVYVSVLAPLNTGAAGELSVDYSIFMWFEDFELAAPCYPQSAKMPKGKSMRSKMRAVSSIEREKDVKPMTPIADALGIAGKAVSSLSAIPGLSAFTGPTSWALSVASGAASFFGWSKPELLSTPGVVLQAINRYSACSDGVSTAQPLALTAGNHVKITDCCSARGEDEMSFAFLKKISGLIHTINWDTSKTVGDIIFVQNISPSLLCHSAHVDSGGQRFSYKSGPPIYYLSPNFAYWRGTIKVRLSFVKTIFHSGRLLITFNPIVNGTSSFFVNTLTTPMLRLIVDIREADELEFDLPFYAPSNYLDIDDVSGRLEIQVLSDLKVPETAPASVKILTYFSGGDDFELAMPKSSLSPGPFQTQSNMIGGDPSPSFVMEASEQSQGEMFTSIRQLLKRYTIMNQEINLPGLPSGYDRCYWPWHGSVYSTTGASSATAGSWTLNGDAYSLISPLYAFYRGGINVKVGNVSPGAVSLDHNTGTAAVHSLLSSFSTLTTDLTKGGSVVGRKVSFIGASDYLSNFTGQAYTVPYHCRTHCSLNAQPSTTMSPSTMNPIPQYSSTGLPGPVDFSQPSTVLVMPGARTATSQIIFSRSVGEDFQFSYFIGCVPRLTNIALLP